jgi:hypothetical protein
MPIDKLDLAATCSRCVNGRVEITASGQYGPVLGCAAREFDDWSFGAWPRKLPTARNFQSSAAVGD